jgi:hypothetical protein
MRSSRCSAAEISRAAPLKLSGLSEIESMPHCTR